MGGHRGTWGSQAGFILAAAGSAVGLGNLWKFPYLCWENGGGAFVATYLGAVVVLGLPLMMAEILVGRRAQASAVPAFAALGGPAWSWLGVLGVLAGVVILAYYTVIAGWSIRSFVLCLEWSFGGYPPDAGARFPAFLADGPQQVLLTTVFSFLTAFVVYRGVGAGIERASKVMMPVLFAILLYLLVTALRLPGAGEGLRHLLEPRFQDLPPQGVLLGVGQAFFSLSLGLGAMVAYGSYLSPQERIGRTAAWVVGLDTAVALIAAMVMFSLLHSIPGLPDRVSGSTVAMLFVTLPELFYTQMPGGTILAPLFYVLVAFAALTSTISLGEVATSYLVDRRNLPRGRATILSASVIWVGSVACALSLGAVPALSSLRVFAGKEGLLATLDHLAANWMLPLGGLGTALFVGWHLPAAAVASELGIREGSPAFVLFRWALRVVAPLAILGLLILVLTGRDLS
ncbi:MAG TPA: sodium-dependent transporter [Myxococcota bacterium]|nr:sodium-dependent transporter [Myxococcota bacterium]HQK50191.1 sodium-dependent transporter [Myxococcota bacterium]